MVSIPDINQLRDDLHQSARPERADALVRFQRLPGAAREPALDAHRPTWTAGPRSAQQVIDYNGALADVCAEFKRCRFDNNAVFNSTFTAADVATVTNTGWPRLGYAIPVFDSRIPRFTADYFHPSLLGQASLAETSWAATFPMD